MENLFEDLVAFSVILLVAGAFITFIGKLIWGGYKENKVLKEIEDEYIK